MEVVGLAGGRGIPDEDGGANGLIRLEEFVEPDGRGPADREEAVTFVDREPCVDGDG